MRKKMGLMRRSFPSSKTPQQAGIMYQKEEQQPLRMSYRKEEEQQPLRMSHPKEKAHRWRPKHQRPRKTPMANMPIMRRMTLQQRSSKATTPQIE